MLILQDILSQEIIQKIGWTLLHFIWQAAVVALLLAILLRVMRKSTPDLRYIFACLALTLIVLLPVITIKLVPVSAPHMATHIEPAPAPAVLATEEIPIAETIVLEERVQAKSVTPVYSVSWKQRTIDALEPALPYIVSGWLVGVFALSVWHLGGWTQLQRLKRRMVKQVDDTLHSKLKVLAQRLRVKQTVQLMESALVQIPTVVGWLRPVILLPASALTGLTSEQLESILAHELAHIKRFDYLVNILQTVVEILGFYHPAVWWVSHKIRAERENCCDDLAVSISGDRVCYARALTSMEEIRAGRGQLVVAASGGNLSGRIRRLVGKDSTEKTSFSWIPAATAILLIAALLIPTTLALTTHNRIEDPAKSLLDKMVEHRSKVKNVQFVAEYDIWHAGHSEEFVENIRKSMREKGIPEQQLQRTTRGISQVPQSRYQILKCTIDNEERAKIERTTGTYDSSGKKLPSGDKNISAWNGVLGTDFNQRRGSTGAARFKDAPPIGISRQGHPWKTFTGNFCRQLAEAIKTEKQISVDESKDGTYRVVFDNDPIITIAVIDPSQGYSCILNENYNKEKLTDRSKAKYKEVAKGIWFPVSGHTESYIPPGSLLSKSIIEMSQIVINDPAFNETFFDIDLPEGTEVRDTVQGKHYVVGSKNVYELPEPQQSVTTKPEDTTDDTEAEIPSEIDPNAWQKAFYAVYRLKDGEILKRIAPPFIPERRNFFLNQPGRHSSNANYHMAIQYTFNWDGDLKEKSARIGSSIPRLNSILESVIGLGNFEYDIPSELLQIDMSGDWIVRKDTPTEALMKTLKEIVKNETAREIDFVKKKVETEVIIAKGKYDLKPLPGVLKPLPGVKEGNYILISTDKTDAYIRGGGGSGTVSRFLQWVGNRINMYIIDETKSEDIKIYWRNHDSSDLLRLSHNKELYNERLDMLLSNLTRQTGLTFERKTAAVEKWFIAEEGAVNAPQKTEPVPAENVQDSDTQVEVKKALSTGKLKQLGLAVAMYADDHDDTLPDSLQKLKPYIRDEQDFNWLLDNIKYLGSGKSAQRNAALIPIAYDRELLEEADGTNVLFLDFSVRFLETEQLEKLGISAAKFLIEARFLSVSEDFLQNIGLDANSPDEAKDLLRLKSEVLAASDGSKTQSLILDDLNVNLLLRAVQAHKDAKVLAVPQVICREGKTAKIRILDNETYYVTGYTEPNNPSEKPEPKFDKVEEGISLSVKPKLTPNKYIDMQFELEITQASGFEEHKFKGKAPYKPPRVQSIAQTTRYIAHNGQTLLFGGHKIADQQDGRTEQKDLLVLIKAQTVGSSEQDKSVQVEDLTVAESGKTTSDVIMQPGIVQSRIVRPNENEQKSDSQVWDDILLATEQEKELSANRFPAPVPAKSPTSSAKDKAHVQVDCLIVEVSLDSKMDRETTIMAENLLGNKISLRDTKVDVLLRKAAGATAATKDKSAENKRVTEQEFNALVEMLTSRGYMKILMNPTLEVVDGGTAKIRSTQDSLEIIPNILEDGNIILQVEATLVFGSAPRGKEQTPIINKRQISTRARVSDGESLIIGGITEKSNVKDSKEQTKEVLFILTPTIITSTPKPSKKTDVQVEGEETASAEKSGPSKLTADKTRIVHFPKDRSLGTLYVRDSDIEGRKSWEGWKELGQARGEISVPEGKELRLVVREKTFENLADLSVLGANDIQDLTVNCRNLQDADMVHLKGLTGLQSLTLSSGRSSYTCPMTGEGLVHLKGMSSLRNLSILFTMINDESLAHLKYLTNLDRLSILNTEEINGVGLAYLKDLPSLRTLSFYMVPIEDAGLEKLKGMDQLERLSLQYTKVTDKGLAYLKGLKGLKYLILPPDTTDAGLANMKGLSSLEELYISDSKVTEDGLIHLKGMPGLKTLSVGGREMNGRGLIHLHDMPKLQEIKISMRMMNDEGMKGLKGLTSVTSLNLGRTQVSDSGLVNVEGLTALEYLCLKNTRITDTGLAYLKGLTSLRTLDLEGTQITDVGLANLQGLSSLRTLWLQRTDITDAGLVYLKGLKSLETLYLSDTQVSDAGLVNLKGLRSLQHLTLNNTHVSGDGLVHLKSLKSLRELYMRVSSISETGLRYLKEMTWLHELGLGEGSISDADLRDLEKVLPDCIVNVRRVRSAVRPPKPEPAPASLLTPARPKGIVEIEKRFESARKLSNLGKALLIYANDHEDKYPDSLHHLPVYSNVEELKWVLANVKYLAHGKTIAVRPDTVIAYDKMLPAERKGTNVLFNDSHVEFVKPERLKELGISATAILIGTQLLSVSEDFLKDIGLDANSVHSSNAWSEHLVADSAAEPNSETYSLILDELHVSFLLKAVQAHKDARVFTSPQALCQEGKTASIAVLTEEYYVMGYTEPNRPSDEPETKLDKMELGTRIWLKPELAPDNENVRLDFKLEIRQLLGYEERRYKGKYKYIVPLTEVVSTQTQLLVPDGKTLLIGGLKITEQEKEPRAPRLRDLPLIGVIFSSNDKIKNHKMLLILVKPIITPQQKARKILRGQEDSEEHIKSLARQLEKKLNPPAD